MKRGPSLGADVEALIGMGIKVGGGGSICMATGRGEIPPNRHNRLTQPRTGPGVAFDYLSKAASLPSRFSMAMSVPTDQVPSPKWIGTRPVDGEVVPLLIGDGELIGHRQDKKVLSSIAPSECEIGGARWRRGTRTRRGSCLGCAGCTGRECSSRLGRRSRMSGSYWLRRRARSRTRWEPMTPWS
jgi:hypothetical protein